MRQVHMYKRIAVVALVGFKKIRRFFKFSKQEECSWSYNTTTYTRTIV